jgi:hypothetical protein
MILIARRHLLSSAGSLCLLALSTSCRGALPAREGVQIGLFVTAGRVAIPSDKRQVRTSGYDRSGTGAASYVQDDDSNLEYVAAHPRSAFTAADGRRFRILAEDARDPRALGLHVGLGQGHGRANRAALAEALSVARKVTLPAGDIDFTADRDFVLPALDGLEIAGQGWSTRLVSQSSAFTLPTLSDLTIRDLWIEQTGTGGATIQSLHCNLRDIRFLRLKITMRDQATCQNNCIGLVMDASPPGKDGLVGLRGLLIEDCWLAPGRMGVEIQNHRELARLYGYQDVTMRSCTVWKAPVFAGMGISLSGWGTDCLVENNRFVGCHGPNVEIIGADRTTVIRNVFQDAVGTPVSASNFRVVQQCRILDNRTTGSSPGSGLFLEAVDGVEVARNEIHTTGIFILKGTNIHLHDNVLVGEETTQLIHLDHARNAIIEKNVLRSVGTDRARARHPMIIAFNETRNCVIRFNRQERFDYDVEQKDLWFAQSEQVRGSSVYGNERRNTRQRFAEPPLSS